MPDASYRNSEPRLSPPVLFGAGSKIPRINQAMMRLLVEEDRSTLLTWIAADSDHKGMTPDFFWAPGSFAMVLGDIYGPGIYVRIDTEPPDSVRLHIQFSPNEVKSGKTLLREWPAFKERVAAAGIRRIVFESKSPRLIGFCSRCFGFKSAGGNDYELILGKE